jgi:hypothetical protein
MKVNRPARQEDAGAARCAACPLGDVATALVEAHADLKPLVTQGILAHRAKRPKRVGLWCRM